MRKLTRRCQWCHELIDERKEKFYIKIESAFFGWPKNYLYHKTCYRAKKDREAMRKYRSRL